MGRKRHSNTTTPLSEDDFSVSSDQLLRNFLQKPAATPVLNLSPPKFNLHHISDDRRYHPQRQAKPAAATQRKHTQLVIPAGKAKLSRPQGLPSRVKFAAPSHVIACVRRKMRKQVLFAKKLTRAGAGSRKRRRTTWSSIKC